MTVDSVLSAVKGVVTAAGLGFVTVTPVEDFRLRLPPEACPALLMRAGDSRETNISGGVPGFREAKWLLDCEVRRYDVYGMNEPTDVELAAGGQAFRQFAESVAAVLRPKERLNGLADVTNCRLAWAQVSSVRTVPLRSPYYTPDVGHVLRLARFRLDICEELYIAAA